MLIGSPSMFIGNEFIDYMKEVILNKCIGGDGTLLKIIQINQYTKGFP